MITRLSPREHENKASNDEDTKILYSDISLWNPQIKISHFTKFEILDRLCCVHYWPVNCVLLVECVCIVQPSCVWVGRDECEPAWQEARSEGGHRNWSVILHSRAYQGFWILKWQFWFCAHIHNDYVTVTVFSVRLLALFSCSLGLSLVIMHGLQGCCSSSVCCGLFSEREAAQGTAFELVWWTRL